MYREMRASFLKSWCIVYQDPYIHIHTIKISNNTFNMSLNRKEQPTLRKKEKIIEITIENILNYLH